MIELIKADFSHIEDVLALRRSVIATVNDLQLEQLDSELIEHSTEYFTNGDHTTVLAYDGETAVGCATICYITVMPTYHHPTGKRAHIMNVYTHEDYRSRGIARRMMNTLLDEARERGVTHITLDSTESGRPLYLSMGFNPSVGSMGLILS